MAKVTAFIRSASKKNDKPTKVRFRLRDGRDTQLFYVSDLSILPNQWSAQGECIKPKVLYNEEQRYAFNRRVSEIKNDFLAWYLGQPNKSALTGDSFTDFYDGAETMQTHERSDFEAIYGRFVEERRVSQVRKKQLRVAGRMVVRYERYMRIISDPKYRFDITKTTAEDIRKFERFAENEYKIADVYPELYDKTDRKPLPRGRNTISGNLIYLRTFFIWARENGLTEATPFGNFKIAPAIYGTPYYLTVEELHTIAQTHFEGKRAINRDVFLFQCCVGCRYSDLVALRGSNVENGYLNYIARKTREGNPITVRVPLNAMATEIYNRYKPSDPNEPLLPVISSQNYNERLKAICKQAGITRYVTILDPLTREQRSEQLCDIASSHLARRTFIGNIYRRVKDQALVSSLSGHKEGSQAFARYRAIDDEMKQELVNLLD